MFSRTYTSIRLKNVVVNFREGYLDIEDTKKWLSGSNTLNQLDGDELIEFEKTLEPMVPKCLKECETFKFLPNHLEEPFLNEFDFTDLNHVKMDMVISANTSNYEVSLFILWLKSLVVTGDIYIKTEYMDDPFKINLHSDIKAYIDGSGDLDFSLPLMAYRDLDNKENSFIESALVFSKGE